MGDYTNVTVIANGLPAAFENSFRDLMDQHLSAPHETDLVDGDACFSGEANVCAPQEINQALRDLMGGDPDAEPPLPPAQFAFQVWGDPKYEWMGDIYVYVPEVGGFTGECDANGAVIVDSTSLITLIDAATDLDALKTEIAALTGRRYTDAYNSYSPSAPAPVTAGT